MVDRLTRVLGGPPTERLRERVRERMSRGLPLTGTISLTNVTVTERAAIDQLLGRRASTGASVSVSLHRLDEVLRTSGIWPDGLGSAIVALTGPVAVRAEERALRDAAWARATEPLAELVSDRPELSGWYARLESAGLLRRLSGDDTTAGDLVRQLCSVLRALPTAMEQLPRFAARVLGNAHALDDGNPLATLVLGAAREIGGAPDGAGAAWRRMVWASVGLLRDELSSTVLTAGLPGECSTATGRALAAWRESGQPVVLTLRQLLSDPPRFEVSGTVVSVCENRSVVAAAADRLGAACGPIVCSSGQPGAAVLVLLDRLAAGGAELRYHGDFDWPGIRIANFLNRQCSWQPWRFRAGDYLRAVRTHEGLPLSGAAAVPSWDAQLGAQMAQVGIQVEEEVVLDDLLWDLRVEGTR